MKKINFFLAFCCLVAALSLQFKEPDYIVSADEVKAYSKSFVPNKAPDVSFSCCTMVAWGYGVISGATGERCKSGTKNCEPKSCPRGEIECEEPF